jgi:uncharacterized protein (TIGR00251 family)
VELPIVNNHLRIQVKPNARASKLLNITAGVVHLAIAAPPENGKANAEAEKFLTKLVGRKATIKSGFTSKTKLVVFYSSSSSKSVSR